MLLIAPKWKGDLKMEFVHVELKRDTWSKPAKYVKSSEEAVTEIKK